MKDGQFEFLDVGLVELDRENPRILALLEETEYTGEITEERLGLALDAASSGSGGDSESSVPRLRRSIKNTGGILQPIQVVPSGDGKFRCIDGNTRLYIYKELLEEEADGGWDRFLH